MDEWVEEFKKRIDDEETRQNRRIETLEHKVDKLTETDTAIKLVQQKLDMVFEDVKKTRQEVEALKNEPADNWKRAVWIVVSVIITAIVTYFWSRVA